MKRFKSRHHCVPVISLSEQLKSCSWPAVLHGSWDTYALRMDNKARSSAVYAFSLHLSRFFSNQITPFLSLFSCALGHPRLWWAYFLFYSLIYFTARDFWYVILRHINYRQYLSLFVKCNLFEDVKGQVTLWLHNLSPLSLSDPHCSKGRHLICSGEPVNAE